MINAPLCKRCARMLRGFALAVQRIGTVDTEAVDTCPWCERNKPDFIYTIQTAD